MSEIIPVVIFLGAPGAGKGTQAAYLSNVRSLPKISTGDMLRSAVQQDTELGRKVREILKEGGLVDDETMLNLVKERISKPDTKAGFILDGYPRNLHQAAQLERVLPDGTKLHVFNISVSEDEIIKRLAGRRTCPKCERIYNIYYHPPKDDEKCDVDGAKLITRNDDHEKVVRKRVATYKKETFPLIDHYRKKGVLHIVNGKESEDDVSNAISNFLESQKIGLSGNGDFQVAR